MNTESSTTHEDQIRGRSSPLAVVIFWAISGAACIYGIVSAFRLRWICDDIYITFRYARNILDGNGWVYNVGERVEGYTHFLWLCLITFFEWLGANPETLVKIMGLVAYGGTLLVFVMIAYSRWDKRSLAIPLTTVVLAVHYDFKVWSGGGLETMLLAFLMAGSFYAFFFWKTSRARRLLVTGILSTFVVLTRPDGALFCAVLALFVAATLWRTRHSAREFFAGCALFLLPFVLILVPYSVWKIDYYGSVFPNTYYAKSGNLSYWSQGFYYIWLFVRSYRSFFLLSLLLAAAVFWWREQKGNAVTQRALSLFSDRTIAPVTFAFLFVVVYCVVFVAKVGGDFMYARFLVPLVPFVYFVVESSLNKLLAKPTYIGFIVSIAVVVLVYSEKGRRDSLFIDRDGQRIDPLACPGGIIDERWYWTREGEDGVSFLDEQIRTGKSMSVYFRDLPVKALVTYQSFAYFSGIATCMDYFGLTDSYIAHLPLEKRSRPGHEKMPPLEYLERTNVNFFFTHVPYDDAFYRRAAFRVGDHVLMAEMFYYDPALLNTLKSRFPDDFSCIDFVKYLDEYLSQAATKSPAELRRDYEKFYRFYFSHVNDVKREQRFRVLLGMRAGG